MDCNPVFLSSYLSCYTHSVCSCLCCWWWHPGTFSGSCILQSFYAENSQCLCRQTSHFLCPMLYQALQATGALCALALSYSLLTPSPSATNTPSPCENICCCHGSLTSAFLVLCLCLQLLLLLTPTEMLSALLAWERGMERIDGKGYQQISRGWWEGEQVVRWVIVSDD